MNTKHYVRVQAQARAPLPWDECVDHTASSRVAAACGDESLQRRRSPADASRRLLAACKHFVFVRPGRNVQRQSFARLLPQRRPEPTPAFALFFGIIMPSERKCPVWRLCLRDFVLVRMSLSQLYCSAATAA